jgi:hypothetical protein
VARRERRPVQAQALGDAGAEVHDGDIGLGDQALDPGTVARVLQVDGDPFLAPVDGLEEGALAGDRELGEVEFSADLARRGLDLDDPGAEVGEPQGRDRAGQELGAVEDQQAFEGPAHARKLSR